MRSTTRSTTLLLRIAATVGLGVGIVAVSGATAANADGIDVDINGCGIAITIGAPTTCPAATTPLLPTVPVVGDVTPVHVGVDLPPVTVPPVTLPPVTLLPVAAPSPAPGTPPAPAPAAPVVSLPPVLGDVVAPVVTNLPIPVATVVVESPIIDCTVDAAAVAVGAECGVDATVPTGVLPPLAATAVDAVIGSTAGLVDPALAGAQTATGLGLQLGPTSRIEAATCTGVAVLSPLPDTCATAATTPTTPTTTPATTTPSTTPGGDAGPVTTVAPGSGVGAGGGGTGSGGSADGGARSNALRPAAAADAAGGTLPTTGVAFGVLAMIGAAAVGIGGLARRAARRPSHGRA